MFHDSLSENFFEISWHNAQTKVTLVNFPKQSPFGAIQAQFVPNYVTCINYSRYFQKYFSIMEFNSQTFQFSKKILFCSKGQFGQKLCNLSICSLRICFKSCSILGYKRSMQCSSTFSIDSLLLLDRDKPKLCNLV